MNDELNETIIKAREMICNHQYKECEKMIRQTMCDYPDNAIPHNLLGILYEKKDDHIGAMKHFRAAWALDPTYRPALMNLDCFGSIFADKRFIFDETDSPAKPALKSTKTFKTIQGG